MFALFVLFILSIGTSVLWTQLHGNLTEQRRAWHREQAFQLAEAGLEHAVAALRKDPAGFTGVSDVPIGAGTYSVKVAPDSEAGRYIVESWGRLDGAAYVHDRAGLRGRLRLAGGQVVEYAWEPIRGVKP